MTKRQLNAYRRAQKEKPEKPKRFNGWSWEKPVHAGPGEHVVLVKCVHHSVPIYVSAVVEHKHIGVAKCRHCGLLRTVL